VGLIKELVLLPAAPLRFPLWVAEQVADEADRRRYSPGAAVQQIEEIEEAREKGELDEEQAEELEGQVIEEQAERAQPTAVPEEGAGDG
jgi:RPA family protein